MKGAGIGNNGTDKFDPRVCSYLDYTSGPAHKDVRPPTEGGRNIRG